jgi:hypothetical protein
VRTLLLCRRGYVKVRSWPIGAGACKNAITQRRLPLASLFLPDVFLPGDSYKTSARAEFAFVA